MDRLDGEIESLMEMSSDGVDDVDEGKTPQIDFNKLFGSMMFPGNMGGAVSPADDGQKSKDKKNQKKNDKSDERKYLSVLFLVQTA